MRQLISRSSSWSQSTHGDGEHHLTVSPFNYVMSVSLGGKAEDTLQEAIHVSMWLQTSSRNNTDQPLFFTQIVCSATSCLSALVPWYLYLSLPHKHIDCITYLSYVSVQGLAGNIWYLKLGNWGKGNERTVRKIRDGPTPWCFHPARGRAHWSQGERAVWKSCPTGAGIFHQGNTYPNLSLLPFDFFPVSPGQSLLEAGGQESPLMWSTASQSLGHVQTEVSEGWIWRARRRVSSTTSSSASCSRHWDQWRLGGQHGLSAYSPTILNHVTVLCSRHGMTSLPKSQTLCPPCASSSAWTALPPFPLGEFLPQFQDEAPVFLFEASPDCVLFTWASSLIPS